MLGCDIGFGELLRAGQVSRMPKLWAAQPANCGPIAAAASGVAAGPVRPTIAEGTAIAVPIRLPAVVSVLAASGGGGILISEPEIAEAVLALARIGIYVEPTCAQAASAYGKLLASGAIGPDEVTVLVLTGTGLKATPRIAELLGMDL